MDELPEAAQILNAKLGLYVKAKSTTSAAAVGVYRVTKPWTTGSTWDTYDGTDTTTSGESLLHLIAPSSGKALEVVYNSTPRVSEVTGPGGGVRHYAYNSKGQLASFTNSAGEKTEYEYGSNGYLDKITAPSGTVEAIAIA